MKTILIVDDEPSIRLVLRHFLRSEYHVVEAASPAEAVDQARLNRPDLVLLDLNLQGYRDGLEVGRTLRSEADPALARVPIVLITGVVSEADIVAAFAAGVDGYIHKPFSSLSLLELVRIHLAREE